MVEVLSPAGNKESFFQALSAGANAIYLGLDLFSARKNAENFTRENLPYYVKYAHLYGVKVYVALNTLVKDKELSDFLSYAEFCNDNGVDGVILQDLFLGKYLHEVFPDLELHLSTQAGVNNLEGALLAKEFGFKRVVLARETPIEDILRITKIIETEAFVQGALCTAFSGQCYMSSFAGNNSGNRGLCKQPCRKKYTLKNEKICKTGYCISLADLSVNDKVFELINAGVFSLKIEGRMRKPSYVYYATRYYRNLIDGKNPSISPLSRSFKRGNYTYGLAFGQDENLISDKVQSHIGEKVGVVCDVSNGFIKVKGTHTFTFSDAGKILRSGLEVGSYYVTENGKIAFSGDCRKGDDVTITTDAKLESCSDNYISPIPVTIDARFFVGKNAQIDAKCKDVTITVCSDYLLEPAKNKPLSESDVSDCFFKCGDYPFSPTVNVRTDNVFLAKSMLNELRRNVYDKLTNALTTFPERRKSDITNKSVNIVDKKSIAVISDDFTDIRDLDYDIAIFSPKDYNDEKSFVDFFDAVRLKPVKTFLYLPAKLSDNGLIERLLQNFDGIYAEGYYGIILAKRLNKLCFLGTGANIYNSLTASVASDYCYDYAVSKEATIAQGKLLGGYYYTGGSLKVMDLYYCPFGKNCKTCKGDDISTLDDGERIFTLRRVKYNSCEFEVYNPYPLLTDGFDKALVNVIGLTLKQKIALIKNAHSPLDCKDAFSSYTTGHSKKSLL